LQAKFNITGMHCESCAIDIQETLKATAGVHSAEVSYNGRQATVDYDENVNQTETLIKKIQDLNYDATITEGELQGEKV
jgi:copper chaperone CopZ